MTSGSAPADFLDQLDILGRLGAVGDLPDAHLIRRLLDGPAADSRAALAALVGRHGPMVLGVCRKTLDDPHDAEDAFQATFLVLARKAGTVRRAESLASWLHGVALRIAGRVRSDAARRRAREREWASRNGPRVEAGDGPRGSWPEIHEELARLPGRFREPLVLCYLEGLTAEQAAERLGCPRGTILSRLARGRDRLRDRLARRGLAPERAFADGPPDSNATRAGVPPALLGATIRAIGGSASVPAPDVVVSLAEEVIRAMSWTKIKSVALVGLPLATLAVVAGASFATIAARDEPAAKSHPQRPVAKDPDPAGLPDPSSPVVPLPPRDRLRDLLRQAAGEAVAVAKADPSPMSGTLTTVAAAQAKVGDLDGARATFDEARREAEGAPGRPASPWNLWRVGHFQVEAGLKAEAAATLRLAFERTPAPEGDFNKDQDVLRTLATIAQGQARAGDREGARATADRLLSSVEDFARSSKVRNPLASIAGDVAAALAASGDFDAAFAWADKVEMGGNVLGQVAEAAAECLSRGDARRFVRVAADRIAGLEAAEQTYFALGDLAKAQATLGDFDAAVKSARAIGEGPSRVNYDMTDGQPYALLCVAIVRQESGDLAGAVETLRDGFRSIGNHPKMRFRDDRYLQIASGQLAAGDLDGATRSVGAMEKPAPDLLASLGRAEAAAGRPDAARATFARALAGADPISLAKVRAMAGDLPGALEALRAIDDPNRRAQALRSVVEARAAAGDVAGALRLALDGPGTPAVRRGLLQGLARGVDERLTVKALDPGPR